MRLLKPKPSNRVQCITRPSMGSTLIIFIALFSSYILIPVGDVEATARYVAVTVGVGLGAGVLFEAIQSLRNLIRVDLLMLVALYALTLLEFIFPQPEIGYALVQSELLPGLHLVLLAFSGILVGRHMVSFHRNTLSTQSQVVELTSQRLLQITLVSFFLGYLYMFLAVNFNPIELFEQLLRPRFSQPWTRGKFGSLSTLFNELALLTYLLPALAGVAVAKPERYALRVRAIVVFCTVFTLFVAFADGTRNVFIVKFIIFLVAYFLTVGRLGLKRLLVVGVIASGLVFAASYYMLEFRTIGLGNYLKSDYSSVLTGRQTLFVDMNLVNISLLTPIFPERHSYLGLEVPCVAIVHPIPRAVWPGKPEGLSISIEDALGAEGMTLATTYIGEMYMAGGYVAVLIVSVMFGMGASWWLRFGQNMSNVYEVALYSSGFFTAAITMRSMMWTTVAMLPTIALYCYFRYAVQSNGMKRRQLPPKRLRN